MADLTIPDFIDRLHAACVDIAFRVKPEYRADIIADYLMNYVATGDDRCAAVAPKTQEQRAAVERFAFRIKAEGLDLTAGAYRDV